MPRPFVFKSEPREEAMENHPPRPSGPNANATNAFNLQTKNEQLRRKLAHSEHRHKELRSDYRRQRDAIVGLKEALGKRTKELEDRKKLEERFHEVELVNNQLAEKRAKDFEDQRNLQARLDEALLLISKLEDSAKAKEAEKQAAEAYNQAVEAEKQAFAAEKYDFETEKQDMVADKQAIKFEKQAVKLQKHAVDLEKNVFEQKINQTHRKIFKAVHDLYEDGL